jgi:P2-related tail formation protein
MYSDDDTAEAVGCPIRISTDQSLFAAPHGFSQRTTSFIACVRQGIHQMLLGHLIALIINAHPKMSPMLSLSKSMLAQSRTSIDVKTRFSSRLTQQRGG